jgi:replication fork protection complex subunit Tof1/Swi1
LYLFQQILDVQASLPKGDSTRDLNQLITFVLRKFFKRVKEDPFLIVEALASKARGRWKELSSYQSDEDDGMGGQKARIKEKVSTSTNRINAFYDVVERRALMVYSSWREDRRSSSSSRRSSCRGASRWKWSWRCFSKLGMRRGSNGLSR